MKTGWNVTFDHVTAASSQEGDYSESGFLAQDVSLREAVEEFLDFSWDYIEGNISPIGDGSYLRWFTAYPSSDNLFRSHDYGEDVISETRSLHIPEGVSVPSRLRLAKLLHCHGVKGA